MYLQEIGFFPAVFVLKIYQMDSRALYLSGESENLSSVAYFSKKVGGKKKI